jgi:hypothetical protein
MDVYAAGCTPRSHVGDTDGGGNMPNASNVVVMDPAPGVAARP